MGLVFKTAVSGYLRNAKQGRFKQSCGQVDPFFQYPFARRGSKPVFEFPFEERQAAMSKFRQLRLSQPIHEMIIHDFIE